MNEMQSRFEPDLDETRVNDIAVIGIAGRFPGASNPREFWENLKGGVNAFRRFSAGEIEDTFGAEVRGSPDYVPVRPHLDNVDQFDAEFFGMLPREAKFTDPQQRVFLECCWEALEDAGYDPATYAGPIGVFAGSSFNSYLLKHVCGDREGIDRFTSDYQVSSYQELLGALPEFLPTRVCYRFNLTGPGVNVQSACSTSLLAIAQACQSLLMYTSDMVLAGGVSITFPQKRGYVATEGAMVSPDGACRPFDASAAGTVFGSGAGAILLKRLADAKADGDHIYGVIRGFGINNDGSVKAGFAAPSVEGQAAVIVQAHAMAGINPREIGYIECHGTATPLGDPIEFAGLERAFREGTDDRGFCVLGSAKGNIGHLDAAAGVTGVIKTLLTLKHERIPPLAGYTKPNPHIDLESSPFTITGTTIDWPRGNAPRIAGVSAFGVGGTNVHLVIEEAPAEQRVESKANAQLLLLSARSPAALAKASQNLADRLASAPDTNVADVAWTLQHGRRRFKHRKAVVATDRAAAITALAGDAPERVQDGAAPEVAPAVHMMFPGQGAQYVGMGADLYAREPQFRTAVDRCADVLAPLIGIDLRLFMQPCTADDAQTLQDKLKDTAIAQPAIFAIEYALASLWMSWGISPKAMVGHSVGEFAAATIAGIFELQDALALVAERGRLMHDVERGSMLSVRLSEQDVLARLPGTLSIAAVNAPTVTVVAGPTPEIEAFEAALSAEKITTRRLVTSHAFHSAMMDPVVDVFRKVVEGVPRRAPRIPILSTLTGDWMTDAEAIDPGYWARHVRMPVRFSAAVQKLRQDAGAALLEVGPGSTLNALARLHAGTQGQVIAASLGGAGATEPDGEAMMSALGTLWLSGIEPDWVAVHGTEARDRRRIPLPTYPFERKRHWIDLPAAVQATSVPAQSTVPISPVSLVSSKDVPSMANDTTAQTVAVPRRDRIHAAILALFEDLSGKSLGDAPQTASFLELGLDSLFLTQATRELQNKIGIKVVFRQLLGDLGSFEALARFADEKLPADKFAEPKAEAPAPAAVPAPQAATSATSSAPAAAPAMLAPIAQTTYQLPDGASALERVMREQLQVMGHLMATQIGALTGVPAVPAIAPATIQPQVLGTQPMLPGPTPAVPLPASAAIAAPAATPPAKPAAKQDFQAFGPYKPLNTAHVATSVAAQEEKIAEIIARYTQRTAKSKALTQQYRKPLADPRVVSGFRENWKEMVYPVITNRSKGSRLWDVDGNEYIDILNGFGPIMFGHRPDFLERAVEQQLHDGFEIGPQSPLAGEIAQMFCEMTGNERMTFCNTGSEAVMAALRVARTVTGRDKVLSFAGDYHGMFDEVLIKAAKNKDGTPSSNPIAPGIPRESVANMIVMDYGTPETLEWIRANAHDLAAVIVEPFQSRRPHFKPIEWLKEVREITRKSNTALVFDEVVTGFRVHPGGAQAAFGIRADMATYGKVLGGGLPIGVLAGTSEFLDALDGGQWQFGDDSVPEVGVTFFAGTFVRHPLALAAVKAVLEELKRQGPELQERLTRRTEQMVARINAVLERYGIPTRINSSYSVMFFSFPSDEKYAPLFYYLLREHGVHALEGFPCFMTTAHSDADIDHIVSAFEKAASEMRGAGLVSGEMLPGVTLPPIEKAPVAHAPLTEPQREIFLAAMLGDDVSCAFNESLSVRLTGNLDVSAITTAVDAVVQRHDALRATIDEDGATLVVAPELKVALEHIDLSARAESDRDAELERLLDTDARTAFDLANGPLIRGFLVKMAANEHVLVLTMHHIVCDGWSCNVILGDLAELYSAAVERRGAVLDPVMSFAAFARSQAARSRSEQADMEAYWLSQFKSVPPLVELPTDRPREDARTYNGTTHRRHIAKEQLERIRQLGTRNGASLFATLFAGFNALVARLSSQNDIVVGVPTAGQSLLDGGALVGHCVNFLPMRTAIAPNATFSELLAQVKETVLDAYDHQDFTYGTLVQRLDIKRDPSRLPLTELQFNLEQVGGGATFAALTSAVEANAKGAVNSDLFLNIVERKDGLGLECDYNTDLYDAATIEAWLAGFEALMAAAAADPSQPVSALPLPEVKAAAALTAADARQLAEWNATEIAYPADRSIVDLFEAQAAATPDAVALSLDGVSLTYGELNSRANRLARRLIRLGVAPEEIVGCCLERSPELIVALLGILKAGGVYVPLDAALPRERLAFMINDTRARFTVTTDTLAKASLSGQNTRPVLISDSDAMSFERSDDRPARSPLPGSLAYVCYTSGSTGQPKGVMVEHRSVVRLVRNSNYCELGPDTVMLQFAPVSFDASTLEIWGTLLNGGRIAIVPPGEPSLAELGRVIREEKVTTAWLTAGLFHIMVDQRLEDFTGLRQLLSGGDVLSAAHVSQVTTRLPSVRMINGYGPTEGTTFTCCHTFEAGKAAPDPVPIGRPISNTRIYILDGDMKRVPIGEAGELFIAGDGLARGYLNNPDLTAQKFVKVDLGDGLVERCYRSGDQARFLPDGTVQFLGRIDNQVKLRGFRIELGEIEVMLQRHPSVRQACVVAAREQGRVNRLVAFCSASEGSEVSELVLSQYLASSLPAYMVPAAIVPVSEFPLTTNGKVDRAKLLDREKASRGKREIVAPAGKDEETLVAIVKEVTQIEQVGVTDNLFELGVDSLKVFQITSRAAKAGVAIMPRTILQARTIRAALAQAASAPAGVSGGLAIKPAVRQRVRLVPVASTSGLTKP
jgi:amino acid adenylation domain-containing protein